MTDDCSYFAHESSIIDQGSVVGEGTKIWHWTHLSSNSKIGDFCNLGQNVYVGDGVVIGNYVKIQNNVSIYSNVFIEDKVFCGPSVVFTNVLMPRSFISQKKKFASTFVRRGSTLGANSTIICGNNLGEYSFIAAGSVVTKDVLPFSLVRGNPARHVAWVSKNAEKIDLPLVGSGRWTSSKYNESYSLVDNKLILEND